MSKQSHSEHPDDGSRQETARRPRRGTRGRLGVIVGGGVGIVLGIAIVVAIIVVQPGAGTSQATSSRSAPTSPTALYVSLASDGGVTVSWQPSRPAPLGYRIYRAMGRNGPYTIVGTVSSPDMDTFTDINDLMVGATYAYTVTAYNSRSESAPTGPILVLVMPPKAPSPTVGLPTPLPTFAPVTSATLTASAGAPKGTGHVTLAPGQSPVAGVPSATSLALPTPTTFTVVPSVTAVPTARPQPSRTPKATATP